jgi:hypothetical protein
MSVGGMIAWPGGRATHLVHLLVLCDTAQDRNAEMGTIEAVRANGLASIADAVLERWLSTNFGAHAVDLAGYRHAEPAEGYVGTCTPCGYEPDIDRVTATQPTLCLVGGRTDATPPALVNR